MAPAIMAAGTIIRSSWHGSSGMRSIEQEACRAHRDDSTGRETVAALAAGAGNARDRNGARNSFARAAAAIGDSP
jgi:hypothetical protein